MIGWTAMTAAAMAAPATAAPAQFAVPSTPAARVVTNTVTHPGEKVAIHVPASAKYVGHERFALYGVADAEIHVFVDADAAKKVQRLYWVQFESYLPSNDHRYNYAEGNRRAEYGGVVTWVGGGPRQTTTPSRAGGDRESVMRILGRGGYTLPAEMMNARLVQMLDDPQGTGRGRRELMIIYAEDLAPTGLSYGQLVANDETTPAWDPLEQPLIDRAAKAVRIERL